MNSRDLKRVAQENAHREARRTRATMRGIVLSENVDGTAQVKLPNGHEITVEPSSLLPWNPQQAVVLLRLGNRIQLLGPSAYGGGNGAEFAIE